MSGRTTDPVRRVFLVAARRTPVARVGGPLRSLGPERLASAVIRAVVDELCIPPDLVADVLLGNAVGPGGNVARLAALEAGLPASVPGATIDRQCGSGLSAILLGVAMVRAGEADCVLAGGVESTSRAPWKVERPTTLYGSQPPQFLGRAPFAPAEIGDPEMGEAADHLADLYRVSRDEQDDFAAESHAKYWRAVQQRWFDRELVPIETDGGWVSRDEAAGAARDEDYLRTFRARLGRLKPAFRPDGTVTAGNACGIHDGAAIVVLASEHAVQTRGWPILAEVCSGVTVGVDPNIPGIGPAPALRVATERAGVAVDGLELVEINEAFAGQVLACVRELGLRPEVLNVSGGALAMGHPYGASGAIIVVRLAHELARRQAHIGSAAIGIGGGMGAAVVLKRTNG